MARISPALLAMLGVLAYKNRGALGQMLETARTPLPDNTNDPSRGSTSGGGLGGGLGGLLGGLLGGGASQGSAGGALSGGLGELVDNFTTRGHGDVANSWVNNGPNQPVQPHQIEDAIGPEALEHLTQQTGLSREELLERLTRNLPEAVNRMTPQGRLPTHQEADKLASQPDLLDGWGGGA